LTVTSLEPALPKLLNVVLHFFSSQYELLCDTKTFERMLLAPERAVKRKMELCSLGSKRQERGEKSICEIAGRRGFDGQYEG